MQVEWFWLCIDKSVLKRKLTCGNESIDAIEVRLHGRFHNSSGAICINLPNGAISRLAYPQ